ncbi:MAG: serine/threonine protein kinase [Planctomycetaceae bacterium]
MHTQAHMTFGNTSIGRTMSRASSILKQQLWLWPIIAFVVLAVVGYGINSAIRHTMEATLTSQLETLLGVESSMLQKWMLIQENNATSLANSQIVRRTAEKLSLANRARESVLATEPMDPLEAARLQEELSAELGPALVSEGYVGFVLTDKTHRVLAATNAEIVGKSVPQYERFLTKALDGIALTTTPFGSVVMMQDEHGRLRTGVPTMFACAPIRDQNLQVIGVLSLRIRPEKEFTNILQMGQIGKSGETIAFDKSGMLVSNSRFDADLILTGVLPDTETAQSILTVSLRDPGGNLLQGHRPGKRRSELPLTKMASRAIEGASGVDVAGYRDYRGIPVVGAWTWLPKYEMGIATEIDYSEAFRPLTILRWVFFSIFALLFLSSAAIYLFMLSLAKAKREAQKMAIEAKQLGQYQLETCIGAGAMGVVYKGHHAMLRRPTAIKLLNVEHVNEASIQRFEHEVQITCKLNHPSTIAIYDYGRTPEGVFYYAMEYLDGINLQTLVEKYGPQPEGRVIQILRQVCGSLFEAHSLGLVHRDIKPANIMLNRRGGESDVVKVLDFGLVKAIDDQRQAQKTGGLSGTPLYMSPEAIQTPDFVDARSDLYAVGAVGYFLLTGQPVFNARTLAELCQQHVTEVPDLPSQRVGHAVTSELENALMSCLEKNRAKRPQTARDLAALLFRAPTANQWTIDDAEAWWGRHDRNQQTATATSDDKPLGPIPANKRALLTSSRASESTSRLEQTMFFKPGEEKK